MAALSVWCWRLEIPPLHHSPVAVTVLTSSSQTKFHSPLRFRIFLPSLNYTISVNFENMILIACINILKIIAKLIMKFCILKSRNLSVRNDDKIDCSGLEPDTNVFQHDFARNCSWFDIKPQPTNIFYHHSLQLKYLCIFSSEIFSHWHHLTVQISQHQSVYLWSGRFKVFVLNLTNHYSMVCGFSVQSCFCFGPKNSYNSNQQLLLISAVTRLSFGWN